VIRESLGRLALRAYPRELARSNGPEMLSVMLDMSSGSPLTFARELVFLVFCGLRERSRVTAASGRRQLLADACNTGLILFVALPLWGLLSRLGMGTSNGAVVMGGLCAAFVALLAGYNRWVGIGGLCAIAIGVTMTVLQGQAPLEDVLNPFVTMAIPTACCLILTIAPGKRPPRLARIWWFALLVALAILLPFNPVGNATVFGVDYQYAFLAAASAIGILRLAYDPRLALGCGLVWAIIALRAAYSEIAFGFAGRDTFTLWVSTLILSLAVIRLMLMREPRTT